MAEVLERNLAEVKEHDSEKKSEDNVFSRITPSYDLLKAAKPDRAEDPGYYGLPILKRPFWKWEIALYFFFEGVSAGSYVLCTVAGFTDKKRHAEAIRAGRFLSFATMLLCPPLLIMDLGRPERFHHMLRVWKKTSPMNHGAWALSGYGTFASLLALLAVPASWLPFGVGAPVLEWLQRYVPVRVLAALGLPFAFTMISYPGVLLETTANPLWSRSNFLGPLFAASSLSNGAAAMALLNYGSDNHKLHHTLHQFEDVTAAAEAVAIGLYLGTAKQAARPLWKGKQSVLFLVGAIGVGIAVPAILRRSESKIVRGGLAPLLTLLGGVALKWSITYAGQESALDPEEASKNAYMEDDKPFWGPKEKVTVYNPPV